MTESDYTKIYTGNFIISQLIIDKLESIGINAVVKNETESGRGAIFGSNIPSTQELLVNNDELDKAIFVVEEVLAATTKA